MNHAEFANTLSHYRERVNHTLTTVIAKKSGSPLLCEAMQYAALNGGKRLRPVLVYAIGQCFNVPCEQFDLIAAAVECIHCYSLIHDDLPAMDDDNLRRGKPTCHIIFDEATAILAGDALQTLAFELLSQPTTLPAKTQLNMIHLLAMYSGADGMGAGQSLDLLAEGKNISAAALEKIHQLKTGALIKASVMMGALGASRNDAQTLQTLDRFSQHLGFAFQLQDDLLDAIGDTKNTGKSAKQDIKKHKATFATCFGIAKTQEKINELTQAAIQALQSLKEETAFLQMLCQNLIHRDK